MPLTNNTDILTQCNINICPIPVAAQSKEWVCGRYLAATAGSNPDGVLYVSFEHRVLSGTNVGFGQITCPEESYWVRLWSWSLNNGEAKGQKGLLYHKKNLYLRVHKYRHCADELALVVMWSPPVYWTGTACGAELNVQRAVCWPTYS